MVGQIAFQGDVIPRIQFDSKAFSMVVADHHCSGCKFPLINIDSLCLGHRSVRKKEVEEQTTYILTKLDSAAPSHLNA